LSRIPAIQILSVAYLIDPKGRVPRACPWVSTKFFEKVQDLSKERDLKKSSGKELSSFLLFSGLLYCGNCGEKLIMKERLNLIRPTLITPVTPSKPEGKNVYHLLDSMSVSWINVFLIKSFLKY